MTAFSIFYQQFSTHSNSEGDVYACLSVADAPFLLRFIPTMLPSVPSISSRVPIVGDGSKKPDRCDDRTLGIAVAFLRSRRWRRSGIPRGACTRPRNCKHCCNLVTLKGATPVITVWWQRWSGTGCSAERRAVCPSVLGLSAAEFTAFTLIPPCFNSKLVWQAQSCMAPHRSRTLRVDFICFVQDKLLFEEDSGCPGALSRLLRWL
jgi:hypothetical protein